MEMEKFSYMLEIDILRNTSQFLGGVLGGGGVLFKGLGHPDAQLAKTMHWSIGYEYGFTSWTIMTQAKYCISKLIN